MKLGYVRLENSIKEIVCRADLLAFKENGYPVSNYIEELCDEFVSVRDNWHDHWDNFEEPKTLCSESEIYGAIWTDKGLIYVAKMNDKGELELL